MCKEGTTGTVKGYSLDQNNEFKLDLDGKMNFIYLYKGAIEIDETEIQSGNLVIFDKNTKKVSAIALDDCVFILAKID